MCVFFFLSVQKPSFDSETSTVFGGAAIVRRNVLRHFQQKRANPDRATSASTSTDISVGETPVSFSSVQTPLPQKFTNHTKLNFPDDNHRPSLPVHTLPNPTSTSTIDLFKTLIRCTPKPHDVKRTYSCYYVWKGIRLVPTQWFPQYDTVLMERIVPEPIYTHVYGKPTCFTLQPPCVMINDKQYAVTDEACYFSLKSF